MSGKRGIVLLALFLLVLVPGIFLASAKQEKNDAVKISSAPQDFKEKYGDKWKIEKDEETGLPKDIRGFNVDLKKEARVKRLTAAQDTPSLMQGFISDNKAALGIEPENLKLNEVEYDTPDSDEKEGVWYMSYVQEHNGIPVFGGVFSSVAIDGKLVKISSSYYPDIQISTMPGVSPEEAKEAAKAASGITAEPEKVFLIIFPEKSKLVRYRLAWQVDFPLIESPLGRWTYIVDANDKTILYRYNDVFTASLSGVVTANIYPEYPDKGQRAVNLTNLNVTARNASTTVSNLTYNGTYNISINAATVNITANFSGPYVKVVNSDMTVSNHTQNDFNLNGIHSWNFSVNDNSYRGEEANVFYHVNVVHDFFIKGDPFDITSMNYQSIATLGVGNNNTGTTCNAFESGGNVNFYGPGSNGVQFCEATSLGADIIYHEYTHAVVEKVYDPLAYWLPSSGQAGAINEGLADYFAATILNRPTIGEGIWSTGPIRFLNNTLQYPSSWSEIHADSRSFSGALWDLRNSTNSSFTDDLVIRAMKAKARTFSEFLEDFLIFDDNNSDLTDGTPHSAVICGAFSTNHSIKSGYCTASLVPYYINDTITSYAWQDAFSKGHKINSSESTDGIAGMADDDLTIPIDLGFNFTYFGTNYTQVYIGSNGIVLFEDATIASFTLWPIPDFTSPNRIVAPYMDDLDPGTSGSGDVYYWRDTTNKRFTIEWHGVSVYGTTTNNTFELILTDDGRIITQYLALATDTLLNGTIGIENAGGTAGVTYINSSNTINNRTPLSICFYANTTNCLIAPNVTSFSPSGATASVAEPNSQLFNITAFSFANKNNTNITWYQNGSAVQNSIGGNTWTFEGGYNTSGNYNITAVATDGLLTVSQEWLFLVNNTGPNATIIYPNGSEYAKGIITLNATITDPDGNNTISVASFYYLNGSLWIFIGNGTNGSGVNYNATWNTSAVADGGYRISVNVTDNTSINSSDISDANFTIDNTPPLINSLNLNGIGNNNWSTVLNITFGFNATEANPGKCVLYHNYSGAYSANVSVNYTSNAFTNFSAVNFAADKINIKWNVYCNDSAGNSAWHAGTANHTINIDSANLIVKLNSPANNTWNRSNFVVFRFTPTDANIETCKLYLNNSAGGPWNANISLPSPPSGAENATNITAIADGVYLWNVWCNDSAGNSAFNSTNYTIKIDTTLPNILVASPANNTKTNSGSVWLNLTTSENANCSHSVFEYDSSGAQVNTTNLTAFSSTGSTSHPELISTYLILQNSSHSITYNVQCNDTAGNNNTNATTIFIDITSPGVLSQYPANASTGIPVNANITINFTENISSSALTSASMILRDVNGNIAAGELQYSSALNQSVFNPYIPLLDNTTYFSNLTPEITDNVGNNISSYVWNFTTAEKDTDGDGNPDWNETDSDNDGIANAADYLTGNLSNINTEKVASGIINLSINNTGNLSALFNGTLLVKIFNGTSQLAELNFTFNESNKLDLTNLTIDLNSNSSKGSVLIRGLKLPGNSAKSVFIDNLSNAAGVCIKDAEVTNLGEISNTCKETNETWIPCPGSSGVYSCTVNGSRYKISGMRNSAIMQSNDTAAPLVTSISAANTGSSTVTVTLSIATDENSTCRYSTSDAAYASMSAMSTTGATSHSNSVSYTSSTSGNYYIRCNDTYGNVMQSSNSTSFSASVSGSSTSSGSGGGGGGGGTTAAAKESFLGFSIDSGATSTKSVSSTGIGFTGVSITAKNTITNADLSIEKLSSKPAGESPEGKVYQYLEITTTIKDSDTSVVKIAFKVEKSWLASSGADENRIALLRLIEGKWTELKTAKLSSDSSNVNYEAESQGFSYYAIAQKAIAASGNATAPIQEANITAPAEGQTPPSGEINITEKSDAAEKKPARGFAFEAKGILLIVFGLVFVAIAVFLIARIFFMRRK